MPKTDQAIRMLIEEPTLRAATLSGPWGVGKTFFVRQFIKDNRDRLADLKLSPAYVSLFGLQSIAEARSRICAAALEVQSSDDDLSAWSKWLRGLSLKLGLPKNVKGLDISSLGSAIQDYLQNRLLRKLFVCIDDLERRSPKIPLPDILGLISELTEERECKCLLILNSEKLGDSSIPFRSMEEKVFDLSLEFNPSPGESIGYAMDARDSEAALAVFESLDCSNIRVMRRCAWIVKTMEASGCPDFHKIRPNLVRQAACLAIFNYVYADVFPDQKKISGWSPFTYAITSRLRKSAPSDEEKQGSELLIRAHFDPQPYDGEIVSLMKTGTFSQPKLCETIGAAVAQLDRKARREEFGTIWNLYYDNFSTGAVELVRRMAEFVRDHRKNLEDEEIATACDLLIRLDPSDTQRPLVIEAMTPLVERVPADKRFDEFRNCPAIMGSGLLDEIAFVRDAASPPLLEVFTGLTNRNPESGAQFHMLVAYSDEEIEKFLIEYKGRRLITRLKNLIERLQGAPLGIEQAFRPRLNAILTRIQDDNELNKERIGDLLKMPRPPGAS